jgi:hypothetical protein
MPHMVQTGVDPGFYVRGRTSWRGSGDLLGPLRVQGSARWGTGGGGGGDKQKPLIAVLHIEVVTRSYVMSTISYFIVRTFDVKHHATHGTILINFGSEKILVLYFSNENVVPFTFICI